MNLPSIVSFSRCGGNVTGTRSSAASCANAPLLLVGRKRRKMFGHNLSKLRCERPGGDFLLRHLRLSLRQNNLRYQECLQFSSNQSQNAIERTAQCLVAQGFAGFQRMGDTSLRVALGAEGDEGLAFEVEDVLLGDELRRGERAAAEDVGELASHQRIVF